MGGEILRAVLESECVTSRPKFYAGRMVLPTPANTPREISTVTTIDKTGWFLLTSFFVQTIGGDGGFSGPINGPGTMLDFNTQMTLENVQTRQQYYPGPGGGTLGNLLASWQSAPTEISDYLLFAPGERLKWTVTAWNYPFVVRDSWWDICYAGIEYLMPKEPSAYGTP